MGGGSFGVSFKALVGQNSSHSAQKQYLAISMRGYSLTFPEDTVIGTFSISFVRAYPDTYTTAYTLRCVEYMLTPIPTRKLKRSNGYLTVNTSLNRFLNRMLRTMHLTYPYPLGIGLSSSKLRVRQLFEHLQVGAQGLGLGAAAMAPSP